MPEINIDDWVKWPNKMGELGDLNSKSEGIMGHWKTATLPQLDTQNEAAVTEDFAKFVNPAKVTSTSIDEGRGERQIAAKMSATKRLPTTIMTLCFEIFGIVLGCGELRAGSRDYAVPDSYC